jgi:hypothetical protein
MRFAKILVDIFSPPRRQERKGTQRSKRMNRNDCATLSKGLPQCHRQPIRSGHGSQTFGGNNNIRGPCLQQLVACISWRSWRLGGSMINPTFAV